MTPGTDCPPTEVSTGSNIRHDFQLVEGGQALVEVEIPRLIHSVSQWFITSDDIIFRTLFSSLSVICEHIFHMFHILLINLYMSIFVYAQVLIITVLVASCIF